MPGRTGRSVAVALLSLAAFVPAASGSVTIQQFRLDPAPNPPPAAGRADLTMLLDVGSPDADDIRDLTISVPAGLLANPSAVPACPAAQLASGCPASSQIGAGTVSITSPVFADVEAKLFMLTPQPGEVARLGLALTNPLDPSRPPVETVQAPVVIRPADFGLDLRFTGLPNTIDIDGPGGQPRVPLTIDRMGLRLEGDVAGASLLRMPGSCRAASGQALIRSHAGATTGPAPSNPSFTPAGCAALPFAPTLAASARLAAADDSVAFTTTIAQAAGEATQSSATVTFPLGIGARLAALGKVCATPSAADCPASLDVGTATATSPLLPRPLSGRVVLRPGAMIVPNVVVVFPPPYPLELTGTTGLGPPLQATFSGIPDIPLSSFTISLAEQGVLAASPELCSGPRIVQGSFGSHSGASAAATATMALEGQCRTAAAPPAGSPTGRARRPTGRVGLSGLARRRPRLALTLTAGEGAEIRRAAIVLPRGLQPVPRRFRGNLIVAARGRRLPASAARFRRGAIRIAAPRAGARRLAATLRWPGLRVGQRLARRAAGRRKPTLTVRVTVIDERGRATTLRLRTKGR
jgi:hypothetical protein